MTFCKVHSANLVTQDVFLVKILQIIVLVVKKDFIKTELTVKYAHILVINVILQLDALLVGSMLGKECPLPHVLVKEIYSVMICFSKNVLPVHLLACGVKAQVKRTAQNVLRNTI